MSSPTDQTHLKATDEIQGLNSARQTQKTSGSEISIYILKLLMKLVERHPSFSEGDACELIQVFNHREFLEGDEHKRNTIMLGVSQTNYESELSYPWDNYFGFDLKPYLEGKIALDFGCFTGGRSIAWHERYGLELIAGTDIKEEYIRAADQFGAKRNSNCKFIKSSGERIPFDDETFDAVLSYDVFEHVRDVRSALTECYRVLKKGGQLFAVFPSYYQPIAHHLEMVTETPCIHWFFSGETLLKAYCEIVDERGEDAHWYKRSNRTLEPWEKCNTINGATLAQVRKILESQDWKACREIYKPIGAIGRRVEGNVLAKLMSVPLVPLTYIPGLQELFLHRNTLILEK